MRTALIRDRNGHPVPDGTRVSFVARNAESAQILDTALGLTAEGVAEAWLSIARPGRVSVVAHSGDTPEGAPLFFDALQEPTPTVALATATATATRTPTTTPTATPTATAAPTPTPTASPASQVTPTSARSTPYALLDAWQGQPLDLLGGSGGILLAVVIGYLWQKTSPPHRQIRSLLAAWTGGLLGYLVYGWGWIPVERWVGGPTWVVGGLLSLLGGLLLIAIAGRGNRLPASPR